MRKMLAMKDRMVEAMPGYTIFIDCSVAHYRTDGSTKTEYVVSAVKDGVVFQKKGKFLDLTAHLVIGEYKDSLTRETMEEA